MKDKDLDRLPMDDRFVILLHKKIMGKTGSAKRRAKKYYTDQYRKTGIIPKPLLLAGKGIMEGRKCSGRKSAITDQVKKRFVEMVKASCNHFDDRFIFVTRNGRTIKNYHFWLEQEFDRKLSLGALRRYARKQNLTLYLNRPDYDEPVESSFCFKDEPVFDLVQVDGCKFRYFMIRGENETWQKPQVIEFYDTGSRVMFVLDAFFSESSQHSVDIFSQFLLSTPFPHKKIRIRPDNAKGFLNLKRPINELNITYSVPNGFYLQPDFTRIQAPKDKVHLESSHRSLHHFEMRIVKHFESRIAKIKPGTLYKNGKKETIAVTYLDIDIQTLRNSGLLESYRLSHNEEKHYFSSNGKISAWVPAQKFHAGLSKNEQLTFAEKDVRHFMKYGFDKVKATVSKKGDITFNNRIYHVAVGRENFSRHNSTKVYLSEFLDKLFLFEYKPDGVLLGEALCKEPFDKPAKQPPVEPNEVERITAYLEKQKMVVDRKRLITIHYRGVSFGVARSIYTQNKKRYESYAIKLRQPEPITGKALFNAFVLDCERQLTPKPVIEYAAFQKD